MSRAMQLQRRGGGAADGAMPPRRWFDEEEEEEPTTAAGGAGCRCRSCAAVMLADCIALGCCPCAVVSMLSLALVKAPLVVGRRCVGRLRSRRRTLLHKKRVRDVAAATAAAGEKAIAKAEADVVAVETASAAGEVAAGGAGDEDEDLAWLEEMYRTGHWGFGRVSISGKTP
ncbi:hypothetical protein E2562_030970 [Oryza meyeriana var. granulata]|uniref:Uncharacterized protein n=1 Tax=Oryza meyeriana var. granulata TaxID=110450 RepID=A0A6G1ER83_9ORYZ|nr:hypothetical protein E2562_030970 [Oryza meyeriana var. granulata]